MCCVKGVRHTHAHAEKQIGENVLYGSTFERGIPPGRRIEQDEVYRVGKLTVNRDDSRRSFAFAFHSNETFFFFFL